MTSNLGARDAERNIIGFGDNYNSNAGSAAVKKFFSPEFRNRLDAIVEFSKLDRTLMKKVTQKFMNELRDMITPRGIEFSYSITVIDWVTERGFTETMGARPMSRLINEQVNRSITWHI